MNGIFLFDDNNTQAKVIRRLIPQFRGLGIFFDDGDSEFIFCQQDKIAAALATKLPIVVMERLDGTQLSGAVRKHIDNPQIKAVIKNTMRNPISLTNEVDWRYHVALMGGDSKQPKPVKRLDKLHLGFTFAAYPALQQFVDREPDFVAPRKYSVAFVGTIEYEVPQIAAHRQAALKAVRAIPHSFSGAGRPLSHPEYLELLHQCYAVVSPWGYGETCYRDYEAIMAGCVLIKPESPWVAQYPSLDIPGCRWDFADLSRHVIDAERNWKRSKDHRIDLREQVVQGIRDIPHRFAGIFSEAISELAWQPASR